MKRLVLLSTGLIFAASMSLAAITADELVLTYQEQGYTKITVKTGLTQIKVKAVMGKAKIKVIYDALTGEILRQKTSRANRKDRGTGVEVPQEERDFLGDGSDDSDEGDDSDDSDESDDDSDESDESDDDSDDSDDSDDDAGAGKSKGAKSKDAKGKDGKDD